MSASNGFIISTNIAEDGGVKCERQCEIWNNNTNEFQYLELSGNFVYQITKTAKIEEYQN